MMKNTLAGCRITFYVIDTFFLVAFKILTWSLTFVGLIIMCLGVCLFRFILFVSWFRISVLFPETWEAFSYFLFEWAFCPFLSFPLLNLTYWVYWSTWWFSVSLLSYLQSFSSFFPFTSLISWFPLNCPHVCWSFHLILCAVELLYWIFHFSYYILQFCDSFLFAYFEVPRLGVKLELQMLAYTTATWDLSHVCYLHHSSWLCHTLNPLNKARYQTASSWILVGFITHWDTMRTLLSFVILMWYLFIFKFLAHRCTYFARFILHYFIFVLPAMVLFLMFLSLIIDCLSLEIQWIFKNYSMNFITSIVVQWSSHPNFIPFLSQTPSPSLHPTTCLFWKP